MFRDLSRSRSMSIRRSASSNVRSRSIRSSSSSRSRSRSVRRSSSSHFRLRSIRRSSSGVRSRSNRRSAARHNTSRTIRRDRSRSIRRFSSRRDRSSSIRRSPARRNRSRSIRRSSSGRDSSRSIRGSSARRDRSRSTRQSSAGLDRSRTIRRSSVGLDRSRTIRRSSARRDRSRSIRRSSVRQGPAHQLPVLTESVSHRYPMSEGRFQKRTIYLLTEIRDQLQKVLTTGNSNIPTTDPVVNIGLNESIEAFKDFDDLLRDKDEFKQYKAAIAQIGGVDFSDHLKKAMSRCMTNRVMANYNMSGKKNKMAFMETNFFKLLKDVIITIHRVTEQQVHDKAANFLKWAPNRLGGGGRKN